MFIEDREWRTVFRLGVATNGEIKGVSCTLAQRDMCSYK